MHLEGEWQWIDGGCTMDFEDWGMAYTANMANDCMLVGGSGWWDADCNTEHGWICEFP